MFGSEWTIRNNWSCDGVNFEKLATRTGLKPYEETSIEPSESRLLREAPNRSWAGVLKLSSCLQLSLIFFLPTGPDST